MQIKPECKNCTKAIVCGKDVFGKPRFGCKNIICIFEAVVENPYHEITIQGENNATFNRSKNNES